MGAVMNQKLIAIYASYGDEAARLCAVFLKTILSKIAPSDWWENKVLNYLSEDQKNDVGNSIESLDLAALLRVFDLNWGNIVLELKKSKKILKKADRTIINAMKDYRIHYAHTKIEGLPTEDIQRDLDTLWRFMKIVGADEEKIQEIKNINKLGFACDYDENELVRITDPIKEVSKKETRSKKVKETVSNKPEKTAHTPSTTKTSKQRNDENNEQMVKPSDQQTYLEEKKPKDKFTYIISSNGINLFHCTYDEVKDKIFSGEIGRDFNIYELGSAIATPGPEIGKVSAFVDFFDKLYMKQEELRQKKIAEEKRMQEEQWEKEAAEQKRRAQEDAKQERKRQEELRQKEIAEEQKKQELIKQEKWKKNRKIIIPLIIVGAAGLLFLIISTGLWIPILIIAVILIIIACNF